MTTRKSTPAPKPSTTGRLAVTHHIMGKTYIEQRDQDTMKHYPLLIVETGKVIPFSSFERRASYLVCWANVDLCMTALDNVIVDRLSGRLEGAK